MRGTVSVLLATWCGWTVLSQGHSASTQAPAPDIPLTAGLTIVLAVRAPEPAAPGKRIARGDYEMVVSITGVSTSGIVETTRIDAADERGKPLQLQIERHVRAPDLANARLQILGFHTEDPVEIPGATSLGPSLAVVGDLRTSGRADYAVRNYRTLSTSTGTLTRVGSASVPFPVLVNGRRVRLPALRATGLLTYDGKVRPWEHDILDHPAHPLTLRFTHGAVGAGLPFTPETTREVVRIDFPDRADGNRAIEQALVTECRAEMPGIYFDFDRATLKPQSTRALTTIAEVLRRQPGWRISIEGHTDNVGTDGYNLDLSARRAATVKNALIGDFGIGAERLVSLGVGARRPVETNDTIAGRARNRRVELVRECAGRSGR